VPDGLQDAAIILAACLSHFFVRRRR
jgi:hypothetical protein